MSSSKCRLSGSGIRTAHSSSVNPYFVFLAEFRKNLRRRGILNLKLTSVARIAGRKWRLMTPAQKSVYIEIAKTNQARIKTTKRAVSRLVQLSGAALIRRSKSTDIAAVLNRILPENS